MGKGVVMLSRVCLCAFARACEDCQSKARHVEGTTAASGGFRLSLPASHGLSVSGCSPSLLLNGLAFVVAAKPLVGASPLSLRFGIPRHSRARFRSGKANPKARRNSGAPLGLPDGGYMRKQPPSGTAHIHGFDPEEACPGAGFDGELLSGVDLPIDRSGAGKKPRGKGAEKGLRTQLKKHAGQNVSRGTCTARASATRHHERLIPSSWLSDVDQAFARDLPSGLYRMGEKGMLRRAGKAVTQPMKGYSWTSCRSS